MFGVIVDDNRCLTKMGKLLYMGYVSRVSRIVCGREQKRLGTKLPAGIGIFRVS